MQTSKAHCGERNWKAIRDRLRRAYYLSRVDHVRKIRDRKLSKFIGKYSFVYRTIKNWDLVNLIFLETELEKQL
jgi:hypothetical protein